MFVKRTLIIEVTLESDGIVLPVLLVQPCIRCSTTFLGRKSRRVRVRGSRNILRPVNKWPVPLFLNIIIRIITESPFYTKPFYKWKLLLQGNCAQDIVSVLTK